MPRMFAKLDYLTATYNSFYLYCLCFMQTQ